MKIDFMRNTAFSVLLRNAMANSSDMLKEFKIPPARNSDGSANKEYTQVTVEVFVNGVSVPFVEEGQIGLDLIMKNIDDHVKEAAVELIRNSKLRKLMDAFDRAEYEIKQLLSDTDIKDII